MKGNRDNFPSNVIREVKERAAFICSKPDCRAMTIAPSTSDDNSVQYIGVVSHITAAAKGGPRYDATIADTDRMSHSNAIFLCASHASMIDKNDGIDYPAETLRSWKSQHEEWVVQQLNKSMAGAATDHIEATSINQTGGMTIGVVNLNLSEAISNDRSVEHDAALFRKLDDCLGEKELRQIANMLLNQHRTTSNKLNVLSELGYQLGLSQNAFANPQIEQAKQTFFQAHDVLFDFLHAEFDQYPYNQTADDYHIRMKPEYNIDLYAVSTANMAAYGALTRRLEDILSAYLNAYGSYRQVVKMNLYI